MSVRACVRAYAAEKGSDGNSQRPENELAGRLKIQEERENVSEHKGCENSRDEI